MPVRASVFSYFELDDLTRLMDAIAGSAMPAGVRVHIGSYGVNREASITVHTYRQGRYSPMFKAEIRTEAWERRRLTADEERRVGRRFAGASRTGRSSCGSRRRSAPAGASSSDAGTATRSGTRVPTGSPSIRGSSTSSARSWRGRRAASTESSSAASCRA